jgi:hypothetical protein
MALAASPDCMASGTPVAMDDPQVVTWKTSTANQFLARAHVQGPIKALYPDQTGHAHFAIQIGPEDSDLLEVIYNLSFESLPPLSVGMTVEACGDYITSNAQAGPYPPSPDGAIIHWLHRNPSGHGHDSGFLAIDGIVYGD